MGPAWTSEPASSLDFPAGEKSLSVVDKGGGEGGGANQQVFSGQQPFLTPDPRIPLTASVPSPPSRTFHRNQPHSPTTIRETLMHGFGTFRGIIDMGRFLYPLFRILEDTPPPPRGGLSPKGSCSGGGGCMETIRVNNLGLCRQGN